EGSSRTGGPERIVHLPGGGVAARPVAPRSVVTRSSRGAPLLAGAEDHPDVAACGRILPMIRRLLPAVTAALVILAPAAVIHAAPAVEGEACAPGVGTTILVDLTPAQEALTVSCVEGVQDS